MEMLTTTKNEYLLQASLTVLHEESREWLNELAFWKDEITFFHDLLRKKTLNFPSTTQARLENLLVEVNASERDDLLKRVQAHEHFLATLLNNSTSQQDDEHYRETHRLLKEEVNQLAKEIRDLKEDIFRFVRG